MMNGVNPVQLIGLLKSRNPQEMVMSMIKNNNINDPLINELIGYAQNGENDKLASVARNYFAKQGLDFDKEYNSLMSLLK